jgi:hypothetical protein
MPAQKRPYVSPETAARLADLRRRMSATEGRTVTTDEVVSRMIDAAEGRIAGASDPEREARRAMIEYLEGLD